MKFDKILQYQKIDQELMTLENEVAKSDERQKLAVAKSRLEGATEMIGKLKAEASDLLAGYAAMKDKIDALKDELDEFDGILEEKYKQEEIVYVNKSDYLNKKEAYNKYLIYEINKKKFTFESDLVYQDVVYKKRDLTKDEEKKMPDALVSYDLYIGDKKLGIAVYLGEDTVYISSYDQYDNKPVYIAKMKKITKKS